MRARFDNLEGWESGEVQPTLKQLEKFALATHTPLGYFFLLEPPEEPLPIRDFRTMHRDNKRPSADLLDTIYAMQRRQDWLTEERREGDFEPLDFVGSARLTDDAVAIGREMRRALGLDDGWAAEVTTWTDAVGVLRNKIEELGVVAVINGVVGNSTSRKLNVQEFRGFALADAYAPLIFVNGADAKSAQMFTLAHELAHLWLGSEGEGLSGFEGIIPGDQLVEKFCDTAAAEFLVPSAELKRIWQEFKNANDVFEKLARKFKVSPVVIARRSMDLRFVDRTSFFSFYNAYTQRERDTKKKTEGGNFFNSQNTRLGKSFARAVMYASLEGRLSFKAAYDLTGLHGGTFQEYGRRIGVSLP